jgi:hypothetical protein
MTNDAPYAPGPASGAELRKEGEKWTLILIRELRHPPGKVWEALTDPARLCEWAPFDSSGSLTAPGSTVRLTWKGTQASTETTVTRAEAPKLLEYGDLRWELEELPQGTRLTLFHKIDRRFASMGAAGWHIALDVLARLLSGNPVERIAGADATKFEGWRRLNREYAARFGVETPEWSTDAGRKS